jgi:hypothetical protein
MERIIGGRRRLGGCHVHSIWWKDAGNHAQRRPIPSFACLSVSGPPVVAPYRAAGSCASLVRLCGQPDHAQQLSPQALAAVVDDPGVEREGLARAIDALFRATDGSAAAASPARRNPRGDRDARRAHRGRTLWRWLSREYPALPGASCGRSPR